MLLAWLNTEVKLFLLNKFAMYQCWLKYSDSIHKNSHFFKLTSHIRVRFLKTLESGPTDSSCIFKSPSQVWLCLGAACLLFSWYGKPCELSFKSGEQWKIQAERRKGLMHPLASEGGCCAWPSSSLLPLLTLLSCTPSHPIYRWAEKVRVCLKIAPIYRETSSSPFSPQQDF